MSSSGASDSEPGGVPVGSLENEDGVCNITGVRLCTGCRWHREIIARSARARAAEGNVPREFGGSSRLGTGIAPSTSSPVSFGEEASTHRPRQASPAPPKPESPDWYADYDSDGTQDRQTHRSQVPSSSASAFAAYTQPLRPWGSSPDAPRDSASRGQLGNLLRRVPASQRLAEQSTDPSRGATAPAPMLSQEQRDADSFRAQMTMVAQGLSQIPTQDSASDSDSSSLDATLTMGQIAAGMGKPARHRSRSREQGRGRGRGGDASDSDSSSLDATLTMGQIAAGMGPPARHRSRSREQGRGRGRGRGGDASRLFDWRGGR